MEKLDSARILSKLDEMIQYVKELRPKEVHCVCPSLKGKPMNRGEFCELSESGHTAEAGLNFQGWMAPL